ncbi:hypothetical protein KJ866_00025 [Patescibacteria group bacterium]|nr:hypothetical protein [Patescibacteria group bacterium]MBU2219550.1 hypothetical protein [Patescibacteria group bacterium]MBU2264619.1 hypothetical protein [Patescibacteria group bacterium]
MFFLVSLTTGLIVLLAAIIFLGAVFYHLFQYKLPNKNHRQPIAIIAVLSIIFIFVGYWIFSGVPWENL